MKLTEITLGEDFDFDSLNLMDNDLLVPKTKEFVLYHYYNKKSHKTVLFKKCYFQGCSKKPFLKWHNFLDHLRSHVGQRPFQCQECG
mmetsp:Transcript_46777/g.34259  ORF Transcript_46777/g.34259 Transcript_46777/m.34259 type:complete len:87 (+) Transcript_46777:404-664(+)